MKKLLLTAMLCLLPIQHPSADMASDRAAYVQKMMGIGLIKKIDYPGGKLPHVWVTPVFLSMDFDSKTTILGVVYGYVFGGDTSQNNILVIRNSVTGKRIGTMTSNLGLQID